MKQSISVFALLTFLVSQGHSDTLTFELTGMSPHVGQKFEARLVDMADQRETDRAGIPAISAADFDVTLVGLETGRSYFLDFYADLNGNGYYDSPPTDHAWRLEVTDVAGNTTVSFSHHTDFYDIPWSYLFTLNFTGMTPHVGQLLEIRLLDITGYEEAGRARIEAIASSDFSVEIAGLSMGHDYFVDFYADFNENGYYDEPSADHAWRLELFDVPGDTSLDFAHNTNFFTIPWDYLFTLTLTDMTPHVGQSFQLRLIETTEQREVGRTKIDTIPVAAFSLAVPGIVMGNDYTVDFFADFNKNGVYDPPSNDHAWRMTFDNAQGNTELSFAHNTDFTDIDWVYLLKLHLTDFSPHLDQLFEARLVDNTLGPQGEVSRASIESVPVDEFSVNLPGLMIGVSYAVDFYADFNENGVYDAPPTDHAWRLTLDDVAGDTLLTFSHNTNFTDVEWPGPVAIETGISLGIPDRFRLHQNYPNPFNPVTTLRYDLTQKSEVTLIIYDIRGRQVRALVHGVEEPGYRSVIWNGTDDRGQQVSTGVYIYRIQTGHDFARTRKMVLLQ